MARQRMTAVSFRRSGRKWHKRGGRRRAATVQHLFNATLAQAAARSPERGVAGVPLLRCAPKAPELQVTPLAQMATVDPQSRGSRSLRAMTREGDGSASKAPLRFSRAGTMSG